MPRYLLSFVVALMSSASIALELAPCNGSTSIHMAAAPAVLLHKNGEAVQPITLEVHHVGEPVQATLRIGDLPPLEISVEPGVQSIQAFAPAVESASQVSALSLIHISEPTRPY